MLEVWKPIPITSNYYEASSAGRIRRAVPGKTTRVGRVLKPTVAGHRTRQRVVNISLGSMTAYHQFTVGALVLDAFVGPRELGRVVKHRSKNTLDDRLSNLYWKPAWWE